MKLIPITTYIKHSSKTWSWHVLCQGTQLKHFTVPQDLTPRSGFTNYETNSCYCQQLQNHTYARVHILVDILWRDCLGKGMLILGQVEVPMLSLTLKPALPNAMTYSSRAWVSDALKSTLCSFIPPVVLLKHRVSSHSHCCWLSPLNFCSVWPRILDSVICVSIPNGIEWQQTQTMSWLTVCLFVFYLMFSLLFVCYCFVTAS